MSKWQIETFEYASIEQMKETILKFIEEKYQYTKHLAVVNREADEAVFIGKDDDENMRQAEIIRDALNKQS